MTPPPSTASARAARFWVPVLAATALLLSLLTTAAPANAASLHRTRAELSYGRSLLRLINAERRVHHLRALKYDSRLRISARRHNLSMARANSLSHQLPGEANFARRISAAGYRWRYAGENIGWNSDMSRRGVLILEKVMYQEQPPNDGHRQNILSRNYRNVGVDVYLDRAHHKVWLTTDFGRQ